MLRRRQRDVEGRNGSKDADGVGLDDQCGSARPAVVGNGRIATFAEDDAFQQQGNHGESGATGVVIEVVFSHKTCCSEEEITVRAGGLKLVSDGYGEGRAAGMAEAEQAGLRLGGLEAGGQLETGLPQLVGNCIDPNDWPVSRGAGDGSCRVLVPDVEDHRREGNKDNSG